MRFGIRHLLLATLIGAAFCAGYRAGQWGDAERWEVYLVGFQLGHERGYMRASEDALMRAKDWKRRGEIDL